MNNVKWQDAEDVDARVQPDTARWVSVVIEMSRYYQLAFSEERVHLAGEWYPRESQHNFVRHLARQVGLSVTFFTLSAKDLSPWRLPIVAVFNDGQPVVLESLNAEGKINVNPLNEKGLTIALDISEVVASTKQAVAMRPVSGAKDIRVDAYVAPWQRGWLRKLIVPELSPYWHVMLASFSANVLGLAGILFSMQVYDRVIPAQSTPTLYVLFSGVVFALLFSFLMTLLRSHVVDMLGKRADIRVSDRVFGHALRLRNSVRPRSTGTFIAQIRELEQVRELITSSTIGAVADLPFFLLFVGVFYLIAGSLAWIPLMAVIVMITPALLMQGSLAKSAQMSMRESSLRNALLVESVQGLDDIKSLQAEQHFQQQWNQYNAATAQASVALRKRVSFLTTWSQTVQMGVFALVILIGAPLAMEGDMTTGALVAASILSSRMLAPMTQITAILTRWQQAKIAMKSLDSIMQLHVDTTSDNHQIHRAVINGSYELSEAEFQHHREDLGPPALHIQKLSIRCGEKIAVLGKNGAGKSTFLQALVGGVERIEGEMTLDGISLSHLDPTDVRRDIGILSQQSRLFHGSLKENLLMGAPRSTDEELLNALQLCGADHLVRQLPKGLDQLIMEGGVGLSGGQKQSILLARLFLRQPNVILLDEPSASLDDHAERLLITNLKRWMGQRTLIVATHRKAMLELVDRVLVLSNGKIILDAPKASALDILTTSKVSI